MLDSDLIKNEFMLDGDVLYLNHAAVAPWPTRTRDAVCAFAEESSSRGSQGYLRWLETERRLRAQLAALINAPAGEDIALLKNTSEALSVVAHGLPWQAGDNVVTSDQEFPSNRIVWESLEPAGVEVRQVDLYADDGPEAALLAACDERTRVLAISSVEYASGLRLDLAALGKACRERDVLFCVDAIQSVGAVGVDVQASQVDFLMADGHKWMLGPEGLALFYCRPGLRERLRLHQFGWHMVEHAEDFDRRDWSPAPDARRFECGSPNMLCIHALDASVSLLREVGSATVEDELLRRSRHVMAAVEASEHLSLTGDTRPGRFAGIVTFRHRRIDSEDLYHRLMARGVMCAKRGGGVRFSPHFYTPLEVIDRAVALAERGGE